MNHLSETSILYCYEKEIKFYYGSPLMICCYLSIKAVCIATSNIDIQTEMLSRQLNIKVWNSKERT